ncbi:MAG: aminotransferase class IV [Clostridia bacterium]|nr:aminotransferase class IV [Clostridia bacterium]
MQNIGYYNGETGPLEEMRVPMLDRACYFGDGIYEVAVTRNHILYAPQEHLDRFYSSLAFMGIKPPMPEQEFLALLHALIRQVDDGEQLVYWQVSRGVALRGHAFPKDAKPSLWVMIVPARVNDCLAAVPVITLEDTRYLHCNIKTINLIPAVLASQKSAEAGCFESILHRGGRVTECAHSNVHILDGGMLYTAPADNFILKGVARGHLLEACHQLSIPVKEEPYTLETLLQADEVLITSTLAQCVRVSTVDGMPVGGKAAGLTERIQDYLRKRYINATTPA